MAQLKSTIVQGALTVTGNVVANKLIKTGGTASQILMADGSVKGIGDLISIPGISVTDTGTKPIVGDITASGHTITVTRIGLDDLGLASAYKYKGSVAKYENLPTSNNAIGDVWNVQSNGMNYAWTGSAWDALGATIDTSNFVTATKNASVSIAGTTKDTYTYNKTAIFAPNGLIMGGTAASAGLVTRGICGASTPDASTGACSKDHLYLNFDSNNTWNAAARAVIINAGEVGTDLGSGMYQYAAVRGDIVKAWVEAKKYLTSHQSLANYVTLDGAQTITGIKTFSTHIKTAENTMGIKLRTHGNYEAGWVYGTTGNEAFTLAIQNPITAFQIVYGTKPSAFAGDTWQTVTPLFQTKDGKVIINRKITATADTTSLKLLDVNGEMAATTIYENGTSLANKYAAKNHNHDGTYLKTEVDTLQTVTNRGASTTKSINALSYKVNSAVTMEYDSSYKALKFVFA